MTPTLSPTVPSTRAASRMSGSPATTRRARQQRQRNLGRGQRLLAHYTDEQGRPRELLARAGAAGSVLVLDRDRATHGDRRLLAHLAEDEPIENADLVCASYLRELAARPCRCRLLSSEDLRSVPFERERQPRSDSEQALEDADPVDRRGCRYRLEPLPSDMSIRELRWCRCPPDWAIGEPQPVSVREAIASLESYEPVRALTRRALSLHAAGHVSTTVVRAELARVQGSPIVLNRRLREVVLERIECEQLSMSEIAIRCGRVKRDRRGNESGETSWLARRLGLLPEGGRSTPTPWIHSDVLALIARDGLGIGPREVELC